ncbi:MAG: aldehyde dehydrogenase family protein [Candidatus Bathyarchaeota archaeon]
MKNHNIANSLQKELDTNLNDLNTQKETWATLSLSEKIEILDQIKKEFLSIMDDWVSISLKNKGVSENDPASSDEWISGPFPVVRYMRILHDSLLEILTKGLPEIPSPITTKNGTLVVRVFPQTFYEKLLWGGITYEVWMQPGETIESLRSNQAKIFRTNYKTSKLSLILGSGNFSAQSAMDILYKCFIENRVVIYKTNPVNSYLHPFLEKTFQILIKKDVLRIVDGGAEVGSFLTAHPLIDEIHHTGSRSTFEIIKKSLGKKVNRKRLTAELGNIGPYIIVPGPWNEKDVAYHVDMLVATFVANAGFNCSTPRMLIMDSNWDKREQFLDEFRSVLSKVPLRCTFYPGAKKRYEDFLKQHPKSEKIGLSESGKLPWTLISVDSEKEDDVCFSVEPFCSIVSETSINSDNVVDFFERSTLFANDKLCGTLVATVIVHPKILEDKSVAKAFEKCIADLKFGSIGVNYWGGGAYLAVVTPWGAYQRFDGKETESGVGIVNNALFLEKTQKTVLRAPFRVRPKPVWFWSKLKNASETFKKLTMFESDPTFWKIPSILWSSLKS